MRGLELLPEQVLAYAAAAPEVTAYRFVLSSDMSTELSYGTLVVGARAVAKALIAADCAPGSHVALLCGHGPDFVTGLLGAFLAGCAAVPLALPSTPAARARAAMILNEAECVAVVADTRLDALPSAEYSKIISGRIVVKVGDQIPATEPAFVTTYPEDVAIIQYSSGSTGTPRGVIVTHGALAAQRRAIERAVQPQREDLVVTWLPPEHDMGLMGGLLTNLWRGGTTIVLSPTSFIRRPILWLEAISRWRGTVSVAPNFAYDLCTRAIPQERRAALDLSSWRVALNGAEPVRSETMERFSEAFEQAGFDARAFMPCYGLAEATLLVSGAERGEGAASSWFDASALERGDVVPSRPGQGRRLASSGLVRTTGGVRIVEHDTGVPCNENRIGEIWIAGDSLGSGYLNRPEDSHATFGVRTAEGGGPWLRSGDTGFLWENELYVTGRIKDIILSHGRTLHPSDLERTLDGTQPQVRAGRIVVHQLEDGAIALIAEIAPSRIKAADTADSPTDVAERLWRRLLSQSGVEAAQVLLVRPGSIMWTTSGKLRRRSTHARLLAEPKLVLLDWQPDNAESRRAQAQAARELALARERGDVTATVILRFFVDWIAAATAIQSTHVDPDMPWADQGLDSLMMTELVLDLELAMGRGIAVERLFDLPDPRSLATALAGECR